MDQNSGFVQRQIISIERSVKVESSCTSLGKEGVGLEGGHITGRSMDNSANTMAVDEKPPNLTEFFLNPRRYNPTAEILHTPANSEGDTALYIAAKAGHVEAVRALLEVPVTKVNWQNQKGITSISVASHKGREEIVKMLIAANADVNIESNNGSTPLIQASHFGEFGHVEVVKLLIKANALVDKHNNKGTTALMRATQEGKEKVVQILIEAGADVSKRNNERMNALMLGSQRGHAAIVQALINHKAEIDGQTAQGSTALMLACKRGHVGVVTVLLTAGAELHQKDSRGRTARDTATKRQHQKILEMLHPAKQMRLMQGAEWSKRECVVLRVFDLYTSGKLVISESQPDISTTPSLAVLVKSLTSPVSNQPVFQNIARFIPLPRLWDDTLAKLPRRCHVDATEAIREAFELMDEVFADLNAVRSKDQTGHLIRLWEDPKLCNLLVHEMGMPNTLLQLVRSWGGTQYVLTTLGGGEVTFQPPVAVRVVHSARELVKWYKARERSAPYSLDPASASTFANTGGSSAEVLEEADGESSDGEMEG
ncbi:unnamed protein product [Discosporangium mesarthrocarpum]